MALCQLSRTGHGQKEQFCSLLQALRPRHIADVAPADCNPGEHQEVERSVCFVYKSVSPGAGGGVLAGLPGPCACPEPISGKVLAIRVVTLYPVPHILH